MSFDSTRIQADTHEFRDEVAGWDEEKLRQEGTDRDIPGSETLDRTTLREAIVSNERDNLRAEVHGSPLLPESPAELGPQ